MYTSISRMMYLGCEFNSGLAERWLGKDSYSNYRESGSRTALIKYGLDGCQGRDIFINYR